MSSPGAGLGYDATPPFSAPLRFFLSAPLFSAAAGGLLLADPGLLASRWTPGALAIVHLLALGFLLQVMLGALLQILPVVAGASFRAPLRVAGLTHAGLCAGSLALVLGFLTGIPALLQAGGGLLGITLAGFLIAAANAIRHAPGTAAPGQTPRDLRLALGGLLVAAMLGLALTLALTRGWGLPIDFVQQVNLHAGWAMLGWAGILLAATSWVVVPMFHITPAYPVRLTRWWAPLALALLIIWNVGTVSGAPAFALVTGLLLLALAAVFPLATLRQQARTRRSQPDAAFGAFRLAMIALLAGLTALIPATLTDQTHWHVLAGILLLHGGFGGATRAMLYKIVPFLAWLHLTQAGIKAPNVRKLMPEAQARAQLRLHALTLLSLIVAMFIPLAGHLAGALLFVESLWLWWNLASVARIWHKQQAARSAPAAV
ncbi:hypothetical protein [Parazoarcus communis]|uniref:Uncharacterized protein n=1 Tax=Parazoarcus communis SWub3 = DSM 12120 TaxID=1121029 RepID=A0A323UUZ8_9RHOO|nr:hypothetical protein [Parazoarcus communis]NMG72812.1 hypothetical protein [Parazoarcus communis SWub3 = DSM 12120]PZA16275.1 hypothetical protein DNK49_11395 [Azoarcus communis] [Parazoarcus communis SWub3 = DSM 12120]